MLKVMGGVWREEDGVLMWRDLDTNTIHMVEIRSFDVTDVPREKRASMFAEGAHS